MSDTEPEISPASDAVTALTPNQDTPQYADFALPDGMTVEPGLLDGFGAFARSHNLTQEQAQAQQAAERQRDQWMSQIRTDPDLGGATGERNLALAVRAVERFGTPALREALDASGLGNHPELVRFCYRIGKAIGEDSFVSTQPSGGRRTAAEVLYPNHPKE